MSLERTKAYLKTYKMEDQIREFPVSSATVELAAEALHTEAGRIAKTLSFLVDGEAVLIVCAGDARIDNAKYKAFFHAKAKMLAPDEVEERIGHAIGGVCPFGIKEGVSSAPFNFSESSTVSHGSSTKAFTSAVTAIFRYFFILPALV